MRTISAATLASGIWNVLRGICWVQNVLDNRKVPEGGYPKYDNNFNAVFDKQSAIIVKTRALLATFVNKKKARALHITT